MGDTLRRVREPVSWLVIILGIGLFLLGVARLVYELIRGDTTLPEVARGEVTLLPVSHVLLLVAVTLSCILVSPVTRRGRTVVRVAAMVILVAALTEAALLVIGLVEAPGGAFATGLEITGGLLSLALKAAAAWFLWQAARHSPRGVELPDADHTNPTGKAAASSVIWRAGEAVGASWTRAGDAATGAAAQSHGVAGEKSDRWDASVAGPTAGEASPADTTPTVDQQIQDRDSAPRAWPTAGDRARGEDPPMSSEVGDESDEGESGEPPVWRSARGDA